MKHQLIIIFIKAFKAAASILGQRVYWAFMSSFIENLECHYKAENCTFVIGSRLAVFRARTLLTKEPETIRWINDLPPGSTLLDIGANVGTYAIYAARRNIKVIAVEPSAENYATLIRNIEINDVQEWVFPICVAVDAETHFGPLYKHYGGKIPGGSGAVFNSSRISDNEEMPSGSEYALGMAIDDLVDMTGVPFPTHMKFDIIGTQDRGLDGAQGVLSRITGAMIETPVMGESNYQRCMEIIQAGGLVLDQNFQSNDPSEQFFSRF